MFYPMIALKARLRRSGLSAAGTLYHWYASSLDQVVVGMLGDTKAAPDSPQNFDFKRFIGFIYRTFPPTTPILRLVCIAAIVWSLSISLPLNPVEPDSTVWVGLLSFGSALGLGLAASISLFSKLLHRFALEYVVRAVEKGLRRWTPDANESRTFREFAFQQFMDPADLELHAAPRFLGPVFVQICIAILLFPLYPILSPHWAYVVLIYFSVCTLDMLLEYWIYIMRLSSDAVWEIFEYLKMHHDAIIQFCPICSNKPEEP